MTTDFSGSSYVGQGEVRQQGWGVWAQRNDVPQVEKRLRTSKRRG